MSKEEHTPAPWEVVPLSGYGGPYAIRMAMPAGSRHPTHYGVQNVGSEANARLIAAAPDMLAALKMVAQHGRIDDSESRTNMVCAAIVKAETGK